MNERAEFEKLVRELTGQALREMAKRAAYQATLPKAGTARSGKVLDFKRRSGGLPTELPEVMVEVLVHHDAPLVSCDLAEE